MIVAPASKRMGFATDSSRRTASLPRPAHSSLSATETSMYLDLRRDALQEPLFAPLQCQILVPEHGEAFVLGGEATQLGKSASCERATSLPRSSNMRTRSTMTASAPSPIRRACLKSMTIGLNRSEASSPVERTPQQKRNEVALQFVHADTTPKHASCRGRRLALALRSYRRCVITDPDRRPREVGTLSMCRL